MPTDNRHIDTIHSPALASKILELNETMENSDPSNYVGHKLIEAIQSMGSGCLFDDMISEEEAKGAIKVLDWILPWIKSLD